ncbi:hypothetical protein Cgig2_008569 [Carnegiea gigantea]|uniref:Uncharacterized protein n=1 Tax=Carnegiea gigantea TaxID=171969 RepID=A0A9Q1GKG1_9CARY|nr:hypothetical protein Cgig2_008569 [Carnegiea gigantea]
MEWDNSDRTGWSGGTSFTGRPGDSYDYSHDSRQQATSTAALEVRSLQGPHQKKGTNLKTQDATLLPTSPPTLPLVVAQPVLVTLQGAPTPFDSNGIILPNPTAMMTNGEGSTNFDILLAMKDDVEEGTDADENVDMFLNLENIKDVKMSMDSSKRKRIEEDEECSSHT